MRRFAGLGFLAGLALSAAGCIMVMGVKAPVTALPDHKQIVEIDGELYLLDLETNKVRKLDKNAMVQTQTITTVEVEKHDN